MKKLLFLLTLIVVLLSEGLSQHVGQGVHLKLMTTPVQLLHPHTPTLRLGLAASFHKLELWAEYGVQIPIVNSFFLTNEDELNLDNLSYWKGRGGIRWMIGDLGGALTQFHLFTGLQAFYFPKSYQREDDYYHMDNSFEDTWYEKANIDLLRMGLQAEVGLRFQGKRIGVEIFAAGGIQRKQVTYTHVDERIADEWGNDFFIRPDRKARESHRPSITLGARIFVLIF